LAYFRDKRVQKELTNILHVHSATYPDIGYRQGMHELLAALYMAVDYDSIDWKSTEIDDQDVLELCDRACVAADAWFLFEAIMVSVNPWYEWREPKIIGPRNGPVEIKPSVAPIVSVCNRIHSQYLSKVDPALWEKMNEAGIEPQIYAM
jgi:TBC1 domain family protein 5